MRRFLVLITLIAACCAAACTTQPTEVPARMLVSWQAQQDALTKQDAARAWRFNGQADDEVRLHLDAKAGGQVTLVLQDDAGRTLDQGSDLNVTLPAKGVYTALVQLVSGEGTTYSLTLSYANQLVPTATLTSTRTPLPTRTPSPTFTASNTPTPTFTFTPTYTPTTIYAPLGTLTGRLEMGAEVEGSFLSAFERHIYLFSGTAGQTVSIRMVGTSGSVDPALTLFDPTGQALATDDDSGGDGAALLRDIHLPDNGEYIVQALGGGPGSYRIGLEATAPPASDPAIPTATPTPPPGTITPVAATGDELQDHVAVLGIIDSSSAFHRYFISAQAGDILTIAARPAEGSPLRPRLEIYTPAGELMLSTGLGYDGQALIPSLGVIETGKYGVFISDDGRAGGAYLLAYGKGSTYTDDFRGGLAPGTPAAGSRTATVRDEWTLALTAGDEIQIEARGAALEIVAPDGSTVANAQDTAQVNVPLSGDYRIYTSGTGYTMLWRYVVTAPTPGPAVLILSAEDPLPAQTYLYYPFQGGAGRRVHIRVEALSDALDPVAALLDSDGETVASGDDSGSSLNPDFDALLPGDGTYKLRVNSYGELGGSVRVTVEVLP